MRASLGSLSQAVDARLTRIGAGNVIGRIWQKDAALWKADSSHQKIISNSLGWLTVTDWMSSRLAEVDAFASEIRASGEFTHVLLCGMGGSSLCPEVFRRTFGAIEGSPRLAVLDTTDPEGLDLVAKQIDPAKTLFVVASKSGTTTEPLAFYKYWYEETRRLRTDPGRAWVAITDPGTKMVEMAEADGFRKIFLNTPDIGGRYSALSLFGMVPAALMGLDVARLQERAAAMAALCSAATPLPDNPGAWLGAILGEAALAGRDKMTIVADPRIESLSLWIEQLVAESTGKEGKGIVPVAGEPVEDVRDYGSDRIFVSIALGDESEELATTLAALETAGHPVVRLTMKDAHDLGAAFFQWEIATAVAGWILGINPFDQPNVQESKDATRELLESYATTGRLQEPAVFARDGSLTIHGPGESAEGEADLVMKQFLGSVGAGDYIALLDYIEETPQVEARLQKIRLFLRDSKRCATTTGYGPRFLHSTGQLHKGGADNGVFIQLTAPDHLDQPIPGWGYGFSVLKQAQASGDFRSLASRGRRALRIDLGDDVLAGLDQLFMLIASVA
jgi:glucose-6-phosphate isomerase